MKKDSHTIKPYDPKQSIQRSATSKSTKQKWSLAFENKEYTWSSEMEKVHILREGVPYDSIEVISQKINIPVKDVLHMLDLPQTTYNKKRREHSLLNGRDSEIILSLTELISYGIEVFNGEKEKFQRWLKKPNISLGGYTPESLLDSITGIQEVKNSLNRIEYGHFA